MSNPVHLIINTHTTRHLETVLKGVSLLNPKPATISLSCDADDSKIAQLAQDCAKRFNIEILYTARPHTGAMRAAQSRNNAVRTLLQNQHNYGHLLFIDGDIVLNPDTIRIHAMLSQQYDIIAGDRLNLNEEQTTIFKQNLAHDKFASPKNLLSEQCRLYKLALKRKKNKLREKLKTRKQREPKIIGCHFSINFKAFCDLNGFDERFEGYGSEDNDLMRRAYAAKYTYGTAICRAKAYHLHHESQALNDWRENPGTKIYLNSLWEIRCVLGVDNPAPQSTAITEMLTKQ